MYFEQVQCVGNLERVSEFFHLQNREIPKAGVNIFLKNAVREFLFSTPLL
ncbi:hypothetical protein GWE_04745 [Chlamydia psittaci NJ1]|nr:hypothetical protein B712_0201 [Chlamydia psittaci NJ1]KPZ36583.1 hypothetical protein GWE_04745 [Chlamydia psittaci NJ1]